MRRAGQRGFLIIEVLVAVIITGLALAALTGLFIRSAMLTTDAAAYTTAANLAQKQLELLKTQDRLFWAENAANTNIPWLDATTAHPVTLNNQAYFISTAARPAQENSKLSRVTVTVRWSEHSVEQTLLYAIDP